ncbi:MAG: 3-dehydroquinate synthase [bacterium]|nr:3-dehydroquinate synthase [bacterium]
MSIIGIHTDVLDYDIVVERGALAKAGELLDLDRKVLIVTDTGVPESYAQAVASQCANPALITIERGEASKCVEQWRGLLSTMLEHGFGRDGCVVAVGGGVVGDLSGFAAACYMRGIDFYNVPTTLLSQVDSSIGGKTAIDLDGVKNVVGAFYQPKKVVIDPDTLATLDRRQLMAGLAEAIKMAATCDAKLFELIERSEPLEADLLQIIEGALAIKSRVVEADPTEKGLRRVLNFGHTIGHAIEALNDGELLHGECVALGMLPMCSADVRARLEAVLERYGLPTRIPASAQQLMPYIAHDKKRTEAGIHTVLVDEIGTFRFELMSAKDIERILERAI